MKLKLCACTHAIQEMCPCVVTNYMMLLLRATALLQSQRLLCHLARPKTDTDCIPVKKWAAGICICGAGILQFGAGTRLPQENGALEFLGAALECCCAALESVLPQKMQRWNPSVFRWNPDSRKIMGRWNPAVFRWNLIPAKNGALESHPVWELKIIKS